MATTAMYPGLPESIEIIGTLESAVLEGGRATQQLIEQVLMCAKSAAALH